MLLIKFKKILNYIYIFLHFDFSSYKNSPTILKLIQLSNFSKICGILKNCCENVEINLKCIHDTPFSQTRKIFDGLDGKTILRPQQP